MCADSQGARRIGRRRFRENWPHRNTGVPSDRSIRCGQQFCLIATGGNVVALGPNQAESVVLPNIRNQSRHATTVIIDGSSPFTRSFTVQILDSRTGVNLFCLLVLLSQKKFLGDVA